MATLTSCRYRWADHHIVQASGGEQQPHEDAALPVAANFTGEGKGHRWAATHTLPPEAGITELLLMERRSVLVPRKPVQSAAGPTGWRHSCAAFIDIPAPGDASLTDTRASQGEKQTEKHSESTEGVCSVQSNESRDGTKKNKKSATWSKVSRHLRQERIEGSRTSGARHWGAKG